MIIRKFMLLISIMCLLSGCSTAVGYKTLNTTDENEKQAETLLKEDSRVKNAVVLLHGDQLLAGIRVNTFERFKKRKIAKELSEELEEMYPDLTVTVSADSKILLETNKLIERNHKEEFSKKMTKLSDLVKEET